MMRGGKGGAEGREGKGAEGRGGERRGGEESDTPFSVQMVKTVSVQVITNFPVEAIPIDIIINECGLACNKEHHTVMRRKKTFKQYDLGQKKY